MCDRREQHKKAQPSGNEVSLGERRAESGLGEGAWRARELAAV